MRNESGDSLLRFLGKLVSNAVKLEWQTDAGRVNFLGMVMAGVVVLVLAAGGTVKWVVESLLAAFGRGDGPSPANDLDALWIFMIWTLACVAMLGILVLRSRKSDPPTTSGD